MTTKLYNDNETLVFSPSWDAPIASRNNYETADRCIGSVFEALTPNKRIDVFALDEDLDLIPA